jgi:hypothetical protein
MAETLDPRWVYAKTPAGGAEVGARSDTLSQGARRLLVLIDGRRPLAALPSTVRPGELPKLIQELLAGGLITLSGIVDELPPGGEMRDPRLEDFKRRIEGAVLRELGPSGSVLEARLLERRRAIAGQARGVDPRGGFGKARSACQGRVRQGAIGRVIRWHKRVKRSLGTGIGREKVSFRQVRGRRRDFGRWLHRAGAKQQGQYQRQQRGRGSGGRAAHGLSSPSWRFRPLAPPWPG